MRLVISSTLVCLLLQFSTALAADDKPSPAVVCKLEPSGAEKKESPGANIKVLPDSSQSVTAHRFGNGKSAFDYTAAAGMLVVRGDQEKPIANIGYVAYTKKDVKDAGARPLAFAFNGGPGSSSIWLHMGALGPRRVVTVDGGITPPAPYRVEDNLQGLLDKADLVFIDPVGTGLSQAACEKKDEDFWDVDADVDSISRFILQYVSDNHRWNSPKYLIGESYGTTRGAAIVDYLQSNLNMALNGVVLVSVATDIEAIFGLAGNDRPYPLFLPSFAAVARYYHLLNPEPQALEPFLDEVRRYALGPFSAALQKGDALSEAEEESVAQQVHRYTGLSADYLKAARFRVTENMFDQELLRNKKQTVARLDARFSGASLDPLAKEAAYDPQSNAVSSAFTAAVLDYLHGDLKFGQGKTYVVSNGDANQKWKWTHKLVANGAPQFTVNTTPDLAHALVTNPHLRVLILTGYYDLATPFAATEYVVSHLGVPAEFRSHVTIKYYESGHMMYLQPQSLKQMKSDLDAFLDATHR